MRTILTIAIAALLFAVPNTQAADRAKSQGVIESARIALNDFKAKAGENKNVATDIAAAEQNLEKAAAALKGGEKIFGGLTDEADADVRHQTALLDLNLKVAASKLEKAKIEAESAVLGKKINAVQAKVKIFDDFRAEIVRLKSELAAKEKGGKELEQLKKEKGALDEQLSALKKEKEALEAVKAENSQLINELKKSEEQKRAVEPNATVVPAAKEPLPSASKNDLPLSMQRVQEPVAESVAVQQKQPAELTPELSNAPIVVPSLPEPVAAEPK